MQRREKTRDEVPLRSKDTIRSKHPYHILYKTFISIFNIKKIYIRKIIQISSTIVHIKPR